MTTLMKYELLKQKSSKLILGGFLLVFEAAFLLGMLIKLNWVIGLAIIGLSLTSVIGFAVVALEAIGTYYKDLTEKQGYMVFMTPHNEYTILAGKILTGILTIIVWTAFIVLLAFADITILSAYFGDVEEALYLIRQIGVGLFGIDVSWGSAIYMVVLIVLEWINMVVTAFLSITLAVTVLRGNKMSGVASFGIFIVLNIVTNWITNRVYALFGMSVSDGITISIDASAEGVNTAVSGIAPAGITFVMTLIFAAAFFAISGTLLKKKLSL